MSGGQGYIGSKISLISRSDIRYVGVLHSINSEDSTVALEHVNSFGTEGRRGNPSEEIPPSDNVFEYIVFRGSDIKDLQVFEPPAPKKAAPPPQQYPNDPAIMSSSMETYVPKQHASAAANYTQAPYYGQTPPATSMPAQQQRDADTRAAKPEPVVAENSVVDVAPVAQPLPATAAARAEVTSTDVEELAKSVSGMNVTGSEKTMPSGPSNKLPGTGEHLIRPNNRGNRNSRVNIRYNAHANSTTAPNSNNNRVYVPNSDFDFETSNAKFNKDNVLKEVVHHNDDEYAANVIAQDEEEVVIPPADDYYNRTKSFFDNISCEAKERQEQGNTKYGDNRRSKFHEERKLNVETFGQASVDQGRHRGYRGRGGHRGHRGRGGYRGGRGGGYNNRQQSTTA